MAAVALVFFVAVAIVPAPAESVDYLIEKGNAEKKKFYSNIDDCPSSPENSNGIKTSYKRITPDLYPNMGKTLCKWYAKEIEREFQEVDTYKRPYGCTKKRQTPQKVYWNWHDGGCKQYTGARKDDPGRTDPPGSGPGRQPNIYQRGCRGSHGHAYDTLANPENVRGHHNFPSRSSGARTRLHCNHNYAGNHDCVCTKEYVVCGDANGPCDANLDCENNPLLCVDDTAGNPQNHQGVGVDPPGTHNIINNKPHMVHKRVDDARDPRTPSREQGIGPNPWWQRSHDGADIHEHGPRDDATRHLR